MSPICLLCVLIVTSPIFYRNHNWMYLPSVILYTSVYVEIVCFTYYESNLLQET